MENFQRESILVVDDEDDILQLVKYNLDIQGYSVACVGTGEMALKSIEESIPDLLILDLMLPGVDGLEVCRILKNNPSTKSIPILMLTAKGEESDIVIGLELGADDYMTKPFSPRVLVARVRTLLRRKPTSIESEGEKIIRLDDLTIYPDLFEVYLHDEQIKLTSTEFKILHLFSRRPGRVFSRSQIVDLVMGEDYPVTDRSVDFHIVSLRKKLKDNGEMIETVRGIGYRIKRN